MVPLWGGSYDGSRFGRRHVFLSSFPVLIRLCLTPNGITRQFGSASALSEGDANHSEDGCVSAEQLPWTGAPTCVGDRKSVV